MLYWFQLNPPSPKVNWYTYKSGVKDPSTRTSQDSSDWKAPDCDHYSPRSRVQALSDDNYLAVIFFALVQFLHRCQIYFREPRMKPLCNVWPIALVQTFTSHVYYQWQEFWPRVNVDINYQNKETVTRTSQKYSQNKETVTRTSQKYSRVPVWCVILIET